MNLRKNERRPIHNSFFCCLREQLRGQREFAPRVPRIEASSHARGYREIGSPAAMRILLKQKVHERNVCQRCHPNPAGLV
jgi:hypothetical protein